MKIYLVGGAVRDRLLGLSVAERDWVVVGATEHELLEAGYTRADADFPVFLHPETGDEYALARIERKTGAGYKGFVVEAGPEISLQQDLARRDLTVNALAEDEAGRLIDYFHGRDDLERRVLRHITPAFEEDPVRILRLARFAARFGDLGFSIAPETLHLMARMAASDDLASLRPERVWREMRKALAEKQPWLFFETLYECGALATLIPGLHAAIWKSPELIPNGPLAALAQAASITSDPRVRFVVVMFGAVDGETAVDLCGRLRVERNYSELLDKVVEYGPAFSNVGGADAEGLLDLLQQTGAFQQGERFRLFLDACRALWSEVAMDNCQRLEQALMVAKAIDAKLLMESGFNGAALGAELKNRRVEAIRMHEEKG